MAQYNLTQVTGKRNKKKGNQNAFWSQMNSSIQPVRFQPPVRSLTEVPIANVQPVKPPQQPVVELVDDNSPHIPTSTIKPKNPAAIIAANTAKSIAANMAKKKAENNDNKIAAKKIAANIAQKAAITTAIHKAAEAIANAVQNPGDDNNAPVVRKPTFRYKTPRERKLLKLQKELQKNLAYNNATSTAIENKSGPSGIPQNAEANQNVPSKVTPQSNEAANTKTTFTAKPTLGNPEEVTEVPLTKKKLKKLKRQLLQQHQQSYVWKKPKPNVTGNQPGTSGKPQNQGANQNVASKEKPQVVQAPTITVVGSTIPILDQTIQKNLKRSNAVSFFKPAVQQPPQQRPQQPPQQPPQQSPQQPPQQSPQQPLHLKKLQGRFDSAYLNYPKGVPKSFLIQQKLSQENNEIVAPDAPIWPNTGFQQPTPTPTLVPPPPSMTMSENTGAPTLPIFVQTDNQVDVQQQYSPSDVYSETGMNPETCEDLESSEQSGQKRLSAFQRLGPVSQPKKPKLTINLTLNKEQPVREVVNDTNDDLDRYTPVHLRQYIINSTDETVVKYLSSWPWRKNVGIRRNATARQSKTVMILEQEQMEEAYEKENFFILITVKGYPSTWTKELVLDAILENVRGYSLIPCFTEFSQHECKFLTLRSRSALVILHKTGFYIHKNGVELTITISQADLSLNQIDYIPRIVLRKRISMGYANMKLNLSAFTLQEDISHFIYFPLNRVSNQNDLIKLQSVVEWDHLTHLDLSHNRLTQISGFDLRTATPRLKHLNLSHNYLDKITVLLNDRDLPLKAIHLEGNPLCNDYITPEHYVKVIKMMFPAVVEIDGVPIQRSGQLPQLKKNYCPDDAQEIAEKFLDVYFPLLDSGLEQRSLIQGMYDDDATLTITYCYKLRYGQIYRRFRNLFLYARFLDEGETDSVMGAMSITKLINRWPHTEHDPVTFTVDVLYHTETTTIIRIGGVLKLTAETLAEDEHLLTFTRTVVLYSEHGDEYKIHNEMVYWDEPTAAIARSAFRVNTISNKNIDLKIESTTDEDLREKYLKIFMKLTTMDKKISERCLEINNWNFKLALEHFTKLLKINNLNSLLIKEVDVIEVN